MTKFNIPTILVVFGATGDLMKKKIVPALFYLHSADKLPKNFHIIAYSRRAWSDDDYRALASEALDTYYKDTIDPAARQAFLELFTYQEGTFENLDDYKRLGEKLGRLDEMWKVCTNKLFYLSVPPQYYQNIFQHLSDSHLTDPCGPEEGWTRVLVEKPFGDDQATARQLDVMLSQLFKEEQIYRIDHYLAKEMLQNILTFRFSNNLFEQVWDNQHIEKIDIRLMESLGVEDRGAFYDKVGALRDVGQNHLLQMLALVTMEPPTHFTADDIRSRRAEALNDLVAMNESAIKTQTFRAQYDGYQGIAGVEPDSQTETYFKICGQLTSKRWAGVPIMMEGGKRLGQPLKEIVITFKHANPCLMCERDEEHSNNKLVIQLEPNEAIFTHFWAKKPGFETAMEERTFDFMMHQTENKAQYVAEYAKLLLDSIAGDQTLFVSTAEIVEMWRVIDPIVKVWQENGVPLAHYAPDMATISEEADKQITCAVPAASGSIAPMKKELGIIGLGKMGAGTARNLLEQGWKVVGYNRSPDDTKELEKEGLVGAYSTKELVSSLTGPRLIWLMLPAGQVIDDMLFGENGIVHYLQPGDVVIDAGNSLYKDAIRRAPLLAEKGIEFFDVGFSGGPGGARNGACLMIGGKYDTFKRYEQLFADLSIPGGYQFFEGMGAGHFVKMVHNGIEYGMMQAIAEGFAIMKASDYKLNLIDVAQIYNHGSVIESRLTAWLQKGFETRGVALEEVSGTVRHTGEGAWTVEAAKELGVPAEIIEGALEFRKMSEQHPSYTGKILSALREQFGGHSISL